MPLPSRGFGGPTYTLAGGIQPTQLDVTPRHTRIGSAEHGHELFPGHLVARHQNRHHVPPGNLAGELQGQRRLADLPQTAEHREPAETTSEAIKLIESGLQPRSRCPPPHCGRDPVGIQSGKASWPRRLLA